MKRVEKKLMVGLDIGTSKIVVIVGEPGEDGGIEVLGVGRAPSYGLKRGVVVNIESTVQAIRGAVEEAELMAGCDIHAVFTGVSGSHIRSIPSHGTVRIRDGEVAPADVERVIDAAKAMAIPADQGILHVLTNEFIVDEQDGVKEPVGMSGVRLEARVHIITGACSASENIRKCIQRCDLQVDDVILQPLASGESVLTDDEQELGVCLVDIGGGTTDLAIFKDGSIHHATVIPIAGDQVTNDIAIALRTPRKHAEELKNSYACALAKLADPEESIEVSSVGDRPPRKLERQTLAEVVEPRYEELFSLVKQELRRTGYEEAIAAGGVVLTGGSSQMEGIEELGEEVFQMPVRRGVPQRVTGLSEIVRNPVYSTGIGLLLFSQRRKPMPTGERQKVGWGRVKNWFHRNF